MYFLIISNGAALAGKSEEVREIENFFNSFIEIERLEDNYYKNIVFYKLNIKSLRKLKILSLTDTTGHIKSRINKLQNLLNDASRIMILRTNGDELPVFGTSGSSGYSGTSGSCGISVNMKYRRDPFISKPRKHFDFHKIRNIKFKRT